jgi:hypothetical protein
MIELGIDVSQLQGLEPHENMDDQEARLIKMIKMLNGEQEEAYKVNGIPQELL